MPKETDTLASVAPNLVVICSFPGRFESVLTLLQTFPADFSAPVVVVQHLSPSQEASAAFLADRQEWERRLPDATSLTVEMVRGECQLHPHTLYVTPAHSSVTISRGAILVQEDVISDTRTGSDTLLSSATCAYKERLVLVLLPATGSDGITEAVAVKRAGGTILLLEPSQFESSKRLSVPPTAVDLTADPTQIGPLLHDFLQTREQAEVDKREIDNMLAFVGSHSNFIPSDLPFSLLLQRIGWRMMRTRQVTLDNYARYLRTHTLEPHTLASAILSPRPCCFPEAAFFATLKRILPAMVESACRGDWTLRFWSAGCRTGEELYALAMVLTDLVGDDLGRFQIKIFATDDDRVALTFAREGYYDAKMLSDLPEEYASRFFEPSQRGYRIVRAIRELIIFGVHDLEHDVPFSHLDLLLCCHGLPTLPPEQQHSLFSRFALALASRKGYLLLGHESHVQPSSSLFERVSSEEPIYRCLRRGQINRSHQKQEGHPARTLLEKTIQSQQVDELPSTRASGFRLFSSLGSSDAVVGSAPFGIIVIDRSYHILSWNRMAEKVLTLPIIETGQDFFHTVYGLPYPQVRTTIDSIFGEGGSMTISPVELALSAGGNGRVFSITVTLLPTEVGSTLRMALYFKDITEQILFKQANLKQAQILEDLTSANSHLAAENAHLVEANQQLREACQAMLTTYEQQQNQLTEEQLTIEELTTVQEELQTTLEEWDQTRQELNQQDVEYIRRLAALQAIVNQEIRQPLAIYDTETATLLISSPSFREVVASMHDRSLVDLPGSRWHEMFMVSRDKEARHAWQTALRSHQPQHFICRSWEITPNVQERQWEWTLTPLLEKEDPRRAHLLLATVNEATVTI